MTNFYFKKLKLSALAVGLFASIGAQAQLSSTGQSIGQIAQNVNSSLYGVTELAYGAAYMLAALFALVALLKFKAHNDNEQQTPLKTPIIFLALAAAFIALPTVLDSGAKTIWGNGVVRQSAAPINRGY